MKKEINHKPLRIVILVLSLVIFMIMFAAAILQGALVYLYLKIWYQTDIPTPQFWRPVPFTIPVSTLVGVVLITLASRIPLKPIHDLIEAINQLSEGNLHVRVHLNLIREFVGPSESFNSIIQELENTELPRPGFTDNFSYEFKTPIISLQDFAEPLKNPDLSEQKQQEYLGIIVHESNRLSQLATSVLNLSKIEDLDIPSDMELFDLTEEVRQSVLFLESKQQKRQLELIIDMEEIEYYGSRNLLNQVWADLVDNAIKFSSDHGKIKLKLHRSGTSSAFRILGSGCGMSEKIDQYISDRFYQDDLSHTTEGSGIGLTVAEKIIRLHDGSITVHSEEGIGTTFVVTLPDIQPRNT